MKKNLLSAPLPALLSMLMWFIFMNFTAPSDTRRHPKAVLQPSKRFKFHSFVDCNMAEAWIGDTFRIFPGKYGEDPVWGTAHDLKYADGRHADEAFESAPEVFR